MAEIWEVAKELIMNQIENIRIWPGLRNCNRGSGVSSHWERNTHTNGQYLVCSHNWGQRTQTIVQVDAIMLDSIVCMQLI